MGTVTKNDHSRLLTLVFVSSLHSLPNSVCTAISEVAPKDLESKNQVITEY